KKDTVPEIPLSRDLVVEDADETFCGAVVAWDKATVTLEDRAGRLRIFELGPASFLVDGKPVTLVRPASHARKGPLRSASGSVAVPNAPARVARESRIYVEGAHDAEFVGKVWGRDLRVRRGVGGDGRGARLARVRPGGRVLGRGRRPARDRRGVRTGPRPAPGRSSRPSGPGLQGESNRRAGPWRTRPGHRTPLRGRLAG